MMTRHGSEYTLSFAALLKMSFGEVIWLDWRHTFRIERVIDGWLVGSSLYALAEELEAGEGELIYTPATVVGEIKIQLSK